MPTDLRLAAMLTDFARTMATDFPIQGILDQLVERIVDILPITGAGVTLISAGSRPRYVAASDDDVLRFERLQADLGEGPSLASFEAGKPISVPDLGVEERFPNFGPQAQEAGLAAVFTFPLRHGRHQLGALDLYRDSPGALDPETTEAAQTLADVATAYLLNAQTRADLVEASVRFRESSLHDALTGLPNRALLIERLNHALVRGRRSGKRVAVLYADLDQFKAVNERHGHGVGDQLLMAVANRLAKALRAGDTLARVSGDEFVILCEDLGGPLEADVIAARLVAELGVAFDLSGIDVSVSASVGIAFAGQGDDVTSEQILHHADTAMYEAKRDGGTRHETLDLRQGHRGELSYDLSGAVARGELRLVYQPIVAAGSSLITGVEALLRWTHPQRGDVPPAVFIPLAERAGLIIDIGRWVLEAACREMASWAGTELAAEALQMSLNVSVHQLMSPNFASTVADVLAATATEPSAVTLELTESAFIQDGARALVVLTDLKDLGVSIALDDFGTGYSSLSHLSRFPVDIVKIDRSFVTDLAGSAASHAIVSAVIDLSHALGMTVTAEGVETADQHRRLLSLGCDSCQGYHFARPTPARELFG